MDRDEPRQSRGEWLHPAAGLHSYPPRKQRWPGPRRRCERCEAVSEGPWKRCPVCDTKFRGTSLVGRLKDRLLGRS